MDSKTKYSLGAALIGAFVLGGVTVVTYSNAQPAASSAGGAEARAIEAMQTERSPVETSFSDMQEEEIRALVYDYLMTNPEVIIDAVNSYQRRLHVEQQERAVDGARANLAKLLDPKHGYIAGAGKEDAKIAVIELFDYHCGYCKRAAPLVKSILDNEKDVQVVFREYPIFGEKSNYAAEIALAAREQDKFIDMHFAMMEASGDLTKDRIKKIAQDNGVSFSKLEFARAKPVVSKSIFETHAIVDEMGVDGTPAFVVASLEGDYVNVVQGFNVDGLIQAIDEARAASK